MNSTIPIIIPAYEPDERLLQLLEELRQADLNNIIIVNDGSSEKYENIFSEASSLIAPDGKLIEYSENQGKGYALKKAFKYVLENLPDVKGVVTADSDGQHTVECIKKIMNALQANPENLVLGVRQFSGDDIPWKSKFGNNLTIKVFQLATGVRVTDTQTGLRGIARPLMSECLAIKENRFEFEMKMLIDGVAKYSVTEVPIETVYESKTNHQTHFNPLKDSYRIYKILLGQGIKFILSSLSSSIIDLGLFSVFCMIFRPRLLAYVAVSTILARIISSIYNYSMNFKFVFRSDENVGKAAAKYFTLVIIQMFASALLVTIGTKLIAIVPEVLIKVIVDTCLFVASYFIQKNIVFHKK